MIRLNCWWCSLLSKVEIIGVWKNSRRDPKMRFLGLGFVGKQSNLFMSLWVHFYFNLNWWWPTRSDWAHEIQLFAVSLLWLSSLGQRLETLQLAPTDISGDCWLLTCMMKEGGEEVGRALTPLRLLRTGIPELWLERGTAVVIPAMADMPYLGPSWVTSRTPLLSLAALISHWNKNWSNTRREAGEAEPSLYRTTGGRENYFTNWQELQQLLSELERIRNIQQTRLEFN